MTLGASRRGLFIIDLEEPLNVPRFLPQGGTWDVADVQWNPHHSRAEYIVSTSSEKLYACSCIKHCTSIFTRYMQLDLELAHRWKDFH